MAIVRISLSCWWVDYGIGFKGYGDFTILIRIPFAGVTPFINSHAMSYSSYFLFVYLSVSVINALLPIRLRSSTNCYKRLQ